MPRAASPDRRNQPDLALTLEHNVSKVDTSRRIASRDMADSVGWSEFESKERFWTSRNGSTCTSQKMDPSAQHLAGAALKAFDITPQEQKDSVSSCCYRAIVILPTFGLSEPSKKHRACQ